MVTEIDERIVPRGPQQANHLDCIRVRPADDQVIIRRYGQDSDRPAARKNPPVTPGSHLAQARAFAADLGRERQSLLPSERSLDRRFERGQPFGDGLRRRFLKFESVSLHVANATAAAVRTCSRRLAANHNRGDVDHAAGTGTIEAGQTVGQLPGPASWPPTWSPRRICIRLQ
jgi:hypothetical protein